MDRTMMRNLVAMKVSSMTSLAWTPRCHSVELVLNGVHQGNYLLIEQVRVDKNRVNVGDDGYLFESDFHYDNEIQWMDWHGRCVQFSDGIPFGIKSPDSDDITPDQIQTGKDIIARTAKAIYGSDFRDPEKGYAAYIDVDSFIDYWIRCGKRIPRVCPRMDGRLYQDVCGRHPAAGIPQRQVGA